MFEHLTRKLTNNYNEVPLFMVTFNLNKYQKDGVKNSCDLKLHPELTDPIIKEMLNDIVDYIRDNYNMEGLSK